MYRPSHRDKVPVDEFQAQHPANGRITASRVRVIDEDGGNLGIMDTRSAVDLARDRDMDLVLIAQAGDPPVARIADYSKFLYQAKQARKEQDRRSRENQISVKEIQLRPVTGQHDIDVKIRHARDWLRDSNRIRIVMKFKGRENAHTAIGFDLMRSFIDQLGDCKVEQQPEMQGRNMVALISPPKA